jgi:hypothetical protein
MKNNTAHINCIDHDCCCKNEIPCAPKKCTCGDYFKNEYLKYLQEEACKEEISEPFSWCDYDPDVVYLVQYRPKPKKKKPLD